MRKKPALIVDLDGTMCDTTHRQHFMETKPKDWKSFYGGIADDKPNLWCFNLVRNMSQDYHIIFVSGRPEEHRDVTKKWLREHITDHLWDNEYQLLMRASGDFRKDSLVKTEIYNLKIEPWYDVLFCVDDRQQVVDAWRDLGLTCLQCAKGDF